MPGALDDLENLLRTIGTHLEESLQLAQTSTQAVETAQAGAHQVGTQGILEHLQALHELVNQVAGATGQANGLVQEALQLTMALRT